MSAAMKKITEKQQQILKRLRSMSNQHREESRKHNALADILCEVEILVESFFEDESSDD